MSKTRLFLLAAAWMTGGLFELSVHYSDYVVVYHDWFGPPPAYAAADPSELDFDEVLAPGPVSS